MVNVRVRNRLTVKDRIGVSCRSADLANDRPIGVRDTVITDARRHREPSEHQAVAWPAM